MAYGLANATLSDMTNRVTDVTVNSLNTDGATGQGETSYQNTKWSEYWGYFNAIPELKQAMMMKAIWVVGKGYTADPETTVILDHIRGFGKDTFKDILYNQYLTARLAGDSYAEIIMDDKKNLINLKPLDPGTIKIIVDEKGMLLRYEQTSKLPGKAAKRFDPEKIFHLAHNRIADQFHGMSDIESMKQTILAEYENFTDMKKIMHRYAKPLVIFKLKTDNQAKIDAFVVKMDNATNKGENIYIPDDENILTYEVVQVNVNNIVMAWRENIKNKFYTSLGLPHTIFGGGAGTESQSKINYLAHEQVFSYDQSWVQDQVWKQLYLKINLNSPVTLLENLQADEAKDANQGLEIQPQDVTPGVGQ